MKTFNKCLSPEDYRESEMGMWLYLYDFAVESRAVPHMPGPHMHRRWEYGMAMEFLRELGGPEANPNILDVGGAGSLFAPIAMYSGYNVTVVDPDPCVFMLIGQIRAVQQHGMGEPQGTAVCLDFMEFNSTDRYDAVVCLSTIEHIEDDVSFVQKLQSHTDKAIFLTTDFSMDGGQYSPGHLRTYTPKTMKNKLYKSLDDKWAMVGAPDWQHTGPYVLGYNFACMGVTNES